MQSTDARHANRKTIAPDEFSGGTAPLLFVFISTNRLSTWCSGE